MVKKICHLIRRILGTNNINELMQEMVAGLYLQMSTQNTEWLKINSFSPGAFNWAMDSLALLNVFKIINNTKPKNILEFGLGESSKLIHQYAAYSGTNALTIEHDKAWENYFVNQFPTLKINIKNLELLEMDFRGKNTFTYKNIESITQNKYNLIVVDGPFGEEWHEYSRIQILDFIPQGLDENFCIFIHDTERKGEQNMLNLLLQKLKSSTIKFHMRDYRSIKWHTVICSDNLKFLTML
jgi:hypothetical protein